MELKNYIENELSGLKRGMDRVLKDMTQPELLWRPSCGCNSMGLIIFHVARSEDMFVQTRIRNKPQLWEEGKWYNKLSMTEAETGGHYDMDQVNAFSLPETKDLLDYYDAIRSNTAEYVKTMDPAELDKKLTIMPFPGETTVAGILSIVVSHTAQHLGELSYLRGLQRGINK